MAANRSNKELSDEAQALGAKLGRKVETQGLGNQQLLALVDELQKAVASAPGSTPMPAQAPALDAPPPAPEVPAPLNGAGDDDIGGPPEPPAPTPPTRFPYAVAPGRSIIGPRGHLNAGDEFKLEDVHGNQKRLAQLIAEGFVVARRQP